MKRAWILTLGIPSAKHFFFLSECQVFYVSKYILFVSQNDYDKTGNIYISCVNALKIIINQVLCIILTVEF